MHAMGVYVEEGRVKRALLCKRGRRIEVEWAAENAALPPKGTVIATGLEAKDVLLRDVHVPLKNKREVLSVLPFQIEPLIPYPLDEMLILPRFAPKQKPNLLILAAHKLMLTHHIDSFCAEKIDPDHVSCIPQALLRAVRYFYPEHDSFSVLHFSKENSCFVIAQQGVLRLVHGLPKHWYTDAASISSMLERLQAFAKNKLSSVPYPLVLTGDVPKDCALEETLKLPDDYSCFVVPLGLALDALLHKDTVQFRQEQFLSKRTIRRHCLHAFSAVALSFACAAVCGVFIFSSLDKRKQTLTSTLADKGFRTASEWKAHINSQHPYSPFAKAIPKVSDALVWLSTHPCLTDGVEITSFHYALAEYPRIAKAYQGYLVRLEVEFTAPSAHLARAFHDSLLAEGTIIDGTKEIGWHAEGNSYRASFFLTPRFL